MKTSEVFRLSLMAPGRLDVVEQALRNDPFFRAMLRDSGQKTQRNRRGVSKRYSNLTVKIVKAFANQGLDAVAMKRHEVLNRAFKEVSGDKRAVAA